MNAIRRAIYFSTTFLMGVACALIGGAVARNRGGSAEAAGFSNHRTHALMGQLRAKTGASFDDAAVGMMIDSDAEGGNIAGLAARSAQDPRLRAIGLQFAADQHQEMEALSRYSREVSTRAGD